MTSEPSGVRFRMKPYLSLVAAVEGVADITKRTNRLSHFLYDVAHGLVGVHVDQNPNPTIPEAICDIAREFADIAELCMELGCLLDKDKLCSDSNDAGKILGRLDMLLQEFENAFNDFAPHQRVPKWFKNLFESQNITDLSLKCNSIKEPLHLHLSILKIADRNRSSNKTLNKKKKKKKYETASLLAREIECAESWVEANRQVIKALMNAERSLPKETTREKLQFQYWTESPGATAGWMYDLVFNNALSAEPTAKRLAARGGTVKTVDSGDGDDLAFDSEDEHNTVPITRELERELAVSNPRRMVINELLARWAGLDYFAVRRIADSNDRSRSRLQTSAQRIIFWHLKNEKISSEDGNSSTLSHFTGGKEPKDRHDESTISWPLNLKTDLVDESPPPKVLTPPARLDVPISQHAASSSQTKPKFPEENTGTSGSVDNSKAFVLAKAHNPSVIITRSSDTGQSSSKPDKDLGDNKPGNQHIWKGNKALPNPSPNGSVRKGFDNSELLVEEVSDLDLDPKEKGFAKGSTPEPSRPSSPDTVVPTNKSNTPRVKPILIKKGQEIQTAGDHPITIRFENDQRERQQSPKRTISLKHNTSKSSRRQYQNDKKNIGQSSSPKVEFVEFDGSSSYHKKEPFQDQGEAASERRSREGASYMRESSNQRKDGTSQKVVVNEPSSGVSRRGTLPNARQMGISIRPDYSFPQSGAVSNMYGMSANFPTAMIPHIPYRSYTLPTHSASYTSNHLEHSIVSDVDNNTAFIELRKRIHELEKGEKAHRSSEDAKKDEALIKAQQVEVENLKKTILELQENARSDAERLERDIRSSDERMKSQTALEEQVRSQTQNVEMQTVLREEEVNRLKDFIKRLQQDDEKKQEWEAQKESLIQYYKEELERKSKESEEMELRFEGYQEEWQETLKTNREHYEALVKAEQKKAQEASKRAERYVNMYNEEHTRRSKEPSAKSGTVNATWDNVDVFKFMEKPPSSIGLSKVMKDEQDEAELQRQQFGNKYDDRYQQPMLQARTHRYTAPSVSTQSSDEASNVIMFPPRAGWSDVGHNQLGNYLSISGFKAMFEEREHATYDPTGRYERIGSGANVLRGTLFWQPPASTAEADLYKSLRNSGWRPTYFRKTVYGQTWFFGAQPVHAQFFSDMYKPQVGAFRLTHANPGSEKEFLVISKDLVETQELEFLGHIYEDAGQEIYLDPTLTSEDIDHIVARSFLAREGRLRKKFRNTQLRATLTKADITEVSSEAGDRFSEAAFSDRDKRVSLWSMWSPWSI